jgi:hypothetical protein
MRTAFLIGALVMTMACPAVSHGFGLLRYTCDLIANQLGVDRGPIPKAFSKYQPPSNGFSACAARLRQPDASRLHIQAEGF